MANQPTEAEHIGVHPEVVEAACLAHDLGHAPFGHLGEQVLNRLVLKTEADGFEGNAQTFRILTKLAVRFETCEGLDLTRATLAACMKYPWVRDSRDPKKAQKWGVYKTEFPDFEFVRLAATDPATKTAEAELMDWADDISYSVHDLEDFHRFGLLPWRSIFSIEGGERLIARAAPTGPKSYRSKLRKAHGRLAQLFEGAAGDVIEQRYDGSRGQRRAIRLLTSTLIGRYIQATSLRGESHEDSFLEINDEARHEVTILKQIAREYIISSPALQAQQLGQSRVMEQLYEDLYPPESEEFIPRRFDYMLAGEGSRARCVADCIATLTESETIALHGRLRGTTAGHIWDPIVR